MHDNSAPSRRRKRSRFTSSAPPSDAQYTTHPPASTQQPGLQPEPESEPKPEPVADAPPPPPPQHPPPPPPPPPPSSSLPPPSAVTALRERVAARLAAQHSTRDPVAETAPPPAKRRRGLRSRFAQAAVSESRESAKPATRTSVLPVVPSISTPTTSVGTPRVYASGMTTGNTRALDVTAIPTGPVQTLRINRAVVQAQRVDAVLRAAGRDLVDADSKTNPYFDAALQPVRSRLQTREFSDVRQGTLAERAKRRREHERVMERRREYANARVEADRSATDLPVLPPRAEEVSMHKPGDVPEVEWWDVPFLQAGKLGAGKENEIEVRETRVTAYIHHPPRIAPTRPPAPPPELRLMLTKDEARKLRRQRRAETQREQREMIATGLMAAPPPKVKLSNVVRVLGAEAGNDPTKVERAVRAQIEGRREKHEAENEARRKTPEERREKKREKRENDKKAGLWAGVFKVGSAIEDASVRYKIGVNAAQNDMTGTLLLNEQCNIVVVEGGAKALRRYKKLMLRRIDWRSSTRVKKEENVLENSVKKEEDSIAGRGKVKMEDVTKSDDKKAISAEDEDGEDNDKGAECVLVWEGEIGSASFDGFTTARVKAEGACRSLFKRHGVEHYWDLCTQASPMGNEKLGESQA